MEGDLEARLGHAPKSLAIAKHLTDGTATGSTAAEVAARHGVSVNTLNEHRRKIRDALKARGVVIEDSAQGVRWRYVDAGEPLSIEPTQSRLARGGPCSAHYAGRTERSGDLVTSSR